VPEGLNIALVLEARDQASEYIEAVKEKVASLAESASAATDKIAESSDKMDESLKLTGDAADRASEQVRASYDLMTSTIDTASGAMADASDKVVESQTAMQEAFARTAVAAEDASVKTDSAAAKTDESAAASDAASSKMDGFSTAALGAGLVLGGALAYGIDKSINAAEEGEVSQGKLDAALKATHQSVQAMGPALDAAEGQARNFGFANDSSRQALTSLEIATGSTKQSVTDLGLAENVARMKGMDLATAASLVAKAHAGSARVLTQLGIAYVPVNAASAALTAKYKALGEAVPPVLAAQAKLEDKQASGAAIMQELTDKVHGQAQAYADTAQGKMAIFHAQLDNLEENMGGAMLPALTMVTGALGSMAGWLGKNTGAAKMIFGALAGLAGVLIAVGVAQKVWNAAQAIGGAAMALYRSGVAAVQMVMGMFTASTEEATEAQVGLDGAMDANPIGAVVLAVTLLVAGLYELYEHVAIVRDIFNTAFDEIKSHWETAVEIFLPFIAAIILLVQHWQDIKNAALEVLNAIESAWSAVASWFNSNVIQPVVGFFQTMWTTLRGWAQDALSFIEGIWNTVAGWFDSNVIEPVKGFFEDFWNHEKQGWEDLWNDVKAVWAAVAGWIFDHVVSPVESLFEVLWADLKQGASKAWDDIKGAFSDAENWAAGIGNKIKDGIEGVWTTIVNDAAKFASNVADAIKAIPRDIGSLGGSILHDIVGGLPSKIASFVMSHVAEGGLVTSPTIALVGEAGPELVVPLSNLPGGMGVINAAGNITPLSVASPVAASAGGGGGTTIINNLTMSGAVYGDINQALNDLGRQIATITLPASGTRLSI